MTLKEAPNHLTNWFDVRRYGARGNGVADDYTAISAAIAAATAAGGGIIYFPSGTYNCASSNRGSLAGSHWLFAIVGDNITIQGEGDASVISVDGGVATSVFFPNGSGKPAGIGSFTSYDFADATGYTITTAARGDSFITTATAGDAGNFAAGDWVFIRTGQLVELTGQGQPDSEINQVRSVNAGTGRVTLRWSLAKPYAQEAVDTGGGFTYRSAVGGAGSNLPFTITKVTDRILHTFAIRDMKIVSASTDAVMIGGNMEGFTLDNVTFETVSQPTSFGNIRHARIINCRAKIESTSGWVYLWAPSTGCTDWLISGTDCSCKSVAYLHIHEGVANYKAIGNTIHNAYDAVNGYNAVSIRGRAYGIQITNNTFVNAGISAFIFIDETCSGGGSITGNRFEGTGTAHAIFCSSDNWTIAHNETPDGADYSLFGNTSYMPVQRLAGWVYAGTQTITLGTIPANFAILRVFLQVAQSFNSDGTDTISVGTDANTVAYATATDVSSGGIKTVTLGAKAGWEANASKTVKAYYVNGGSEPSNGRALVVVEYAIIPWEV